jgi:hypothetical protein
MIIFFIKILRKNLKNILALQLIFTIVINIGIYANPGEDFTLVLLPDTQNESQYAPQMYNSQTQWIVNNKITRNIVFVTHVGDIVNNANSTSEYDNADAAMDKLDAGNVNYSVGPGNHDIPYTNYNLYFGVSRFSGKSYYGGHYGSGNENNYSLFSASGMDFILINLQYQPITAMLDWADSLLKANSDRRGIVESHNILNTNNDWSNQGIYIALKDNPNLFLMVCGHMHSASDGAAYRAELGDDGHTIHIMMANYQDFNNGNGYLRILRFSPANNMIYATTYSPYIDSYITTDPDQMNMEYNMTISDPDVIVKTKIFLEGPYNTSTDEMTTELKTGGYIPSTSPYTEDYRTVSSIPNNVTDWILVQLRSTYNGSAVVSKSAFLHKDGRIVADDGTTNEIEMTASVGSYYIVIKHRNHLTVMSANTVSLPNSIEYDFTTGSDKYYGTDGAKELEPGVWGMWAGDVNGDGVIKYSDIDNDRLQMLIKLGYVQTSTTTGYYNEDINMDGEVRYSDINNDRLIILNNLNYIQTSTKSTQVPN